MVLLVWARKWAALWTDELIGGWGEADWGEGHWNLSSAGSLCRQGPATGRDATLCGCTDVRSVVLLVCIYTQTVSLLCNLAICTVYPHYIRGWECVRLCLFASSWCGLGMYTTFLDTGRGTRHCSSCYCWSIWECQHWKWASQTGELTPPMTFHRSNWLFPGQQCTFTRRPLVYTVLISLCEWCGLYMYSEVTFFRVVHIWRNVWFPWFILDDLHCM